MQTELSAKIVGDALILTEGQFLAVVPRRHRSSELYPIAFFLVAYSMVKDMTELYPVDRAVLEALRPAEYEALLSRIKAARDEQVARLQAVS